MSEFNHQLSSIESIKFHNFIIACSNNKEVICQAMILDRVAYVWLNDVNSSSADMSSLTLAMQTKFEKLPITSCLFAEDEEQQTFSQGLASKLAKVFQMQVFVSANFQIVQFFDYLSEIDGMTITAMRTFLK